MLKPNKKSISQYFHYSKQQTQRSNHMKPEGSKASRNTEVLKSSPNKEQMNYAKQNAYQGQRSHPPPFLVNQTSIRDYQK